MMAPTRASVRPLLRPLAEELDAAGGGLDQPESPSRSWCSCRAVRPEETVDLARAHRERDAAHGEEVAGTVSRARWPAAPPCDHRARRRSPLATRPRRSARGSPSLQPSANSLPASATPSAPALSGARRVFPTLLRVGGGCGASLAKMCPKCGCRRVVGARLETPARRRAATAFRRTVSGCDGRMRRCVQKAAWGAPDSASHERGSLVVTRRDPSLRSG